MKVQRIRWLGNILNQEVIVKKGLGRSVLNNRGRGRPRVRWKQRNKKI